MSSAYHVSLAADARSGALDDVLGWNAFLHRHLDWRSPTDWLGREPYLILSDFPSSSYPVARTLAVLACPPDPPEVAWIRVFGFAPVFINPLEAWQVLWQAARADLEQTSSVQVAAAVVAEMPWLEEAMEMSGFQCTHHVVGMRWQQATLPGDIPVSGMQIRAMTAGDLEAVTQVDEAAFSCLWHYSCETLLLAYRNAACATVALDESGSIIGYQISMRSEEGAHLSRLAVHPQYCARGIGYALTRDMLTRFHNRRIFSVTVNTQDNNAASQRLYRKLGFQPEESAYPVYEYPLREVVN